MKKYSYRNKIYSVVPCSENDIPSHTERVLSYWKGTNTNINYQYTLLKACIEEKTAFKVIDENNKCYGCLYWKPIDNEIYLTHFLWFKNFIIVGLGLDYIYKYTDCKIVRYIPHQRIKPSYKSLLTEINIRYFYNSQLAIDVDIHNNKIKRLYNKYFINRNIKEV